MAGLNYWQKKAKAMKFGQAEDRPQDEMKKFLMYRRRKNFDLDILEPNPTRKDNIRLWVPPNHEDRENFEKNLKLSDNTNFVFVQDDVQFDFMLSVLAVSGVIAVDLEYNDDHSYLGMTALIQLSNYDMDYFVDPFTLFSRVQRDLKPILEDGSIIKVMHGCANDVRNLQRDFGIYVVGVIDTQILYNIYKSIPSGTMIKFDNMAKSFYRPNELAYLSENEKSILTFADFRQRPLPKKIHLYARADVHGLIRMYLLMKSSVGTEGMLRAAEQTNYLLLKKGLTYTKDYQKPPLSTLGKTSKYFKMNPDQKNLFERILCWREDLAKRIDEKPEYMILAEDIATLMEKSVVSEEDVIGKVSGYSESFSSWSKTLKRILTEGIPYLDKIESTPCNNCLKEGHCAWGCEEYYSKENAKKLYAKKPKCKTQVNTRRRERKEVNRLLREAENQ